MPRVDVQVACPVYDSFRVQQVAGMFDVPLSETATENFQVELPAADDHWQIGLIVGPSGSGKSTIAAAAFDGSLYRGGPWPAAQAVVDVLGDIPVRQAVQLFTAVGFGSPPSWIKPYDALSGGERFRCDLARALAHGICTAGTVVFDEFTSVVDRQVARVCAAAISKGIRRGHIGCRFVAVTCHYDVAQWLAPDWVLDMATGELTRRCLRRPGIELQIHRCPRRVWSLFSRHHYLSGSLSAAARCYVTTWNDQPVHFCATLPLIAKKRRRRFTRIVTLPDFQGVGIGMRATEAVAGIERGEGYRVNVTSSHPSLIAHCRRSPEWRTVGVRKTGSRRSSLTAAADYHNSAGRAVVSFEYVGDGGSP